jgi:hypothetical protein
LFYFGWYQGAVYSNLLASGICSLLVLWRAKVHIRRGHEETRRANAENKAEIAQMLADHHAAVVAAVTPREGP